MTVTEFGNPEAAMVLVQPVDARDLSTTEGEIREIRRLSTVDFHLMAVQVDRWNDDLSPWAAPAVFGREDFGCGAGGLLQEILTRCSGADKTFLTGGYSLAGLFALWAACQTDRFAAVAAASPSVWFPGFTDYLRTHSLHSRAVYLSLGDREEKTRNPVMATVGSRIREVCEILRVDGIRCALEWNSGNHFRDPELRTGRAFAWALNSLSGQQAE